MRRAGGTVAVVEQQTGQNRFKRLYIQGVSNSGDAMPSLRYMRLQALLPLLIHGGEPRSALVIGLGTGITAGALLPYPGLEQRVCVELLPAVVRAAPLFQGNFGVAAALRVVGTASPAALLATWITDWSGVEHYVDGAPPVTDDRARIEYTIWVRPKEFGRVLPRLLALHSMPPLRGTDEAFLKAVADERDRLLAFYEAGRHAYNGERELWARGMRRVMREDGDNPYCRWFIGGPR